MQRHQPSPSLARVFALGLAAACGTGGGQAADNGQRALGATPVVPEGGEKETTDVDRYAIVPPSSAPTPSLPTQTQPSEPPRACPNGPEPSVFVSGNAITGIAQSETHLYWYANAIFRQPKAGGPPEKVSDVEPYGGRLLIEGSALYWVSYPAIYRLPIDGGQEPERVVNDASSVDAWMPRGSQLYYFSDPAQGQGGAPSGGFGSQLRAAPTSGGAAQLLADQQWARDRLAADATGVYWYYSPAYSPDGLSGANAGHGGEIEKYAFATGAVTPITTTDGNIEWLQVAGDRLIWIDGAQLWSAAPDGSDRTVLGTSSLFRALTSDGTTAYWASSVPGDDYSDIIGVPLTGGSPRTIACHVSSVYGMVADASAVYYYSWVGDVIGKLPKPQ